jgi:dipeptidyl aminopeptidase/acylaminoacyl peptidase
LQPVAGAEGPVDELRIDAFTNTPVAIVDSSFMPKTTWIDPQLKAIAEKAERAFKGKIVSLESWTNDRTRAILRVSSGDAPATYYLLDAAAMRADIVGEEYPQLAGQRLGSKTSITYAARDGVSIPAFLTLPANKPATNLPLVVLPHGGPEAQDSPDFDWLSQFIATLGYAVLQPQFRGSSGLGAAWADSGRGQWGARMQDDLTDGVKALIAKGTVDPKKVCIVGASYGGYAALAGAAFTPDLYACAASVNGVSDLNAMLGALKKRAGGGTSVAINYWVEHFGEKSDAELARVSPVNAAAAIRADILLVAGKDDTVVAADQTRAMALALAKANKAPTVVELAGEDHWLSNADTRERTLGALETLLRRNLGH